MPTYQYRCADCGEERDVVQSFTDDALTDCPVCDGRLRKVFSAVGVVFKGSGFYRTDSRSSGTPSGDGASKNGSDGSSGESGGESAKTSDSGTQSDSGTKADSTSKESTSKESKSGTKDSGSSAKQPSAA